MNTNIERLITDLTESEAKAGLQDSVLDLIWKYYLESNPVDDGLIRQREDAIEPIFQELSVKSADMLTGLIVDLCTAYQRAALLEGIHVGFRLFDELAANSQNHRLSRWLE